MKKKILMITGRQDRTCDYLQNKYQEISFFRLNLDQFSTYFVTATKSGFEIETDDSTITQESCEAIYYRKPWMQDLTGIFDDKYHRFSHSEVLSLVDGIIESFEGPCLSKPSVLRRANNKILQLRLAHEIGFNVPDSVITNSFSRVRGLGADRSIVKPLSIGTVDHPGVREYVQTNLLDWDVDSSFLNYSPSYFQKYIEKDFELRVTVIGDRFHTVRIDSKNKVDWRKRNNEISYSLTELPREITDKCKKLMKRLNMEFGCFDFMVKDSIFYFLEMNANGQWAWLEEITRCEISKNLISYLKNEADDENIKGA